jgi:uncharacterized protein (DUF302 family)
MSEWKTTQTGLTVGDTIALFESLLTSRGITVFGIYDHGANAREAGLSLDDEVVIVFGSPKVGTVLMQDNPDVGYELPLRILVRNDNGMTRVIYRDPESLIEAYGLSDSQPEVRRLSELLREMTGRAGLR